MGDRPTLIAWDFGVSPDHDESLGPLQEQTQQRGHPWGPATRGTSDPGDGPIADTEVETGLISGTESVGLDHPARLDRHRAIGTQRHGFDDAV